MITARAVDGLPEIELGFDLAAAVVDRLASGPEPAALEPGDVLVVAHKAISKLEGRTRRLSDVEPTERARALALEHGRDPRHVQVVLDESATLIRAQRGVLIAETRHGFVCANAGVDASNAFEEGTLVLLPLDPDASARVLRARLATLTGVRPGIVITDSFGRAWRSGQCDVAIGVAGLRPLEDWRGRRDGHGRELRATIVAIADELAAAADLVRRKDSQQPVVLIRGSGRHVTAEDGPGVAPLIRARQHDLFR